MAAQPSPTVVPLVLVVGIAATFVLTSIYSDKQHFSLGSTALPGVTRSFSSFSTNAEEAGLSRIYAGQHTRRDHVAGQTLGHDVAGFVLHNALPPAPDSSGK